MLAEGESQGPTYFGSEKTGKGPNSEVAFETSFGAFADSYNEAVGDTGGYDHRNTIDPPLFELAGEVTGKVAYDLACGNGYVARRLIRDGAQKVWASDISEELITLSRTKYPAKAISYSVRDAADFRGIPEDHFDLVLMNMAIFYVKELDSLVRGVHSILKPGGRFVFSLDHPLRFVAYKAIHAYDVDVVEEYEEYLVEKATTTYNAWTGREDLNIYSRPMNSYFNACGRNGLDIRAIREPKTVTGTAERPMKSRVPYKMVIQAVKSP